MVRFIIAALMAMASAAQAQEGDARRGLALARSQCSECHAIAIGDRELSTAAQEQLTGPAGYFRGYNGLPFPENGTPTPDRYGDPLLCQWMIDLGYQDLR